MRILQKVVQGAAARAHEENGQIDGAPAAEAGGCRSVHVELEMNGPVPGIAWANADGILMTISLRTPKCD